MPVDVDLFEEHGEVAALWPHRPYHGRTVVCFDRHLDLKPLAPGGEEALRATADGNVSPAELVRRLPVRGVPGAFGLDDFWSAAAVVAGLTDLVWVPSWRSYEGWQAHAVDSVSLITTGGRPTRPSTRPCCLTVTLCGVRLAVVPPDLLAGHLDRHVHTDVVTDIDLDWLVDEHGRFEHTAQDLAELVGVCGGELAAMTWSTRSGFLPSEYRTVGADVAARLGLRARESSFLPATPWPEDLMLRVHRGTATPAAGPADEEGGVEQGIAVALHGLAQAGLSPDRAQECFEQAAGHGYHSSWLAYKIGAARYANGDHRTARQYLREAVRLDPQDTLGAHARIMGARATLRLEGPAAALSEFQALGAELPLRRGVWKTIRMLARAEGDMDTARTAEGQLRLLDRLSGPGAAEPEVEGA
ncbi:tetratricopeptide repeat protein [Streptomyces griseorubiginosus]|uniref:tetratricopeptide repeat protein n=1 Tax=Streptomyces griseorubiginosus TaxID=67304 RepID=UPI003454E8B6